MNNEEIMKQVHRESSLEELTNKWLFTLSQVRACMQKARADQDKISRADERKKVLQLIKDILPTKWWNNYKDEIEQLAEQSEGGKE